MLYKVGEEVTHIEKLSLPCLGCVFLWQWGSGNFVEPRTNDLNFGACGKVSAVGHGLSASKGVAFWAGKLHLLLSLYYMRDAGTCSCFGRGRCPPPPSTDALCSPFSSRNQVRLLPLQSSLRHEPQSKRGVMGPYSLRRLLRKSFRMLLGCFDWPLHRGRVTFRLFSSSMYWGLLNIRPGFIGDLSSMCFVVLSLKGGKNGY